MLSYDKIIKIVHPLVIKTIDQLAKENKTEELKKWLTECENEIALRQSQKIDTYSLFCEKYYLQMSLGSQK